MQRAYPILRRLLATSQMLTWCSAIGMVETAHGEPWTGYAELSAATGDRTLGQANWFQPIHQSRESLVFADARASLDDDERGELNLGAAYRRYIGDGASILGGYAYFDRQRTPDDNYFNGATIGAEILGDPWDFRVNGYLPESGHELTNRAVTPGDGSLRLVGNGVVESRGTVLGFDERALRGFDVEIGRTLPAIAGLRSLRGYVAGYRFDADGVEDVTGVRVRLDARTNGRLSFGFEIADDDARGTGVLFELRTRLGWSKPAQPEDRDLRWERMTDRIVRDVDIVTGRVTAPRVLASLDEPLLDQSGQPIRIFYVDNRAPASGAGTIEQPDDTLTEALARAGENTIVYVFQGDGTGRGQDAGAVLKPGQSLLGQGVPLVVNGVTMIPATLAPVLSNLQGGFVVALADHSEVAGFLIEGRAGVSVDNVTGARIHDNVITGASIGVSLRIRDRVSSIDIFRNQIVRNAGDAIGAHVGPTDGAAPSLSLRVYDNVLSDNGGAAVALSASTAPFLGREVLLDARIDRNRMERNSGGVIASSVGLANANIGLSDNLIANNSGDGISLAASALVSSGGRLNADVRSNEIISNAGRGLHADACSSLFGGCSVSLMATDNIIRGNSGDGVSIHAQPGALLIEFVDGGAVTATLDGNSITANGAAGVRFDIGSDKPVTSVGGPLFSRIDARLVGNSIEANRTFALEFIESVPYQDIYSGTTTIVSADSYGTFALNSGANRILGGSVGPGVILVDGGTIDARGNWWGSPIGLDPAGVTSRNGGTIDASSPLTQDPTP